MPMRNRILLLAFSSISLMSAVQAQSPACTWATSAVFDQSATIFTQTPDYLVATHPYDGAVLIGLSRWIENYSADTYGDLQLIHYASDGSIVWQTEWMGSGLASGLRGLPDGHVVAMGEFLDSLRFDAGLVLSTTDNFPHAFVALLTSSGDMEWAVDLNTSFNQAREPRSPRAAPDGAILFGLRSGGSKVVRMDMDGAVLSSIPQSPPALYSVDVDDEGNIYVTGSCASAAGVNFNGTTFIPDVSGSGYNRYLVRYRPDGSPAWARFSGDVTCTTSEARTDGQGSVYWAGLLFAEADFDTHHLNGPANGSTPDFHLCRLDTAGSYIWVREGPGGQGNGVGPGLAQYLDFDAQGSIVLAGMGKGTLLWEGGLELTMNGASDPLLMGFNSDGDLLYCKRGDSDDQFDKAHAVSSAPDGSLYIAGLSRRTIQFDDQSVTITSNTNTPFVARYADVGTSIQGEQVGEPILYPVPARDRLHVQSPWPLVLLECRDALGRSFNVTMRHGVIEIGSLPPGTYALLLKDSNGERYTSRFVKE